ncbi:MAG: DUF6036 family nucleotidyltransferase [Eubacteriales bacterium]|nr:DUF6036 family nucleotidyltransferase [Eubacteriales bacterium]
MSVDKAFTKENLDDCLRRLAKEFRRLNGKSIPAELILIGGAAVLANYGFRDMTYDIDAIIQASSAMKDAINHVGDELGLPNGWLNSDFVKTKSYSPKIIQVSKYYKTYSNVLQIRTVSGEYLVAMKLMSGRKYKNDISDIVGILWEENKKGTPISYEKIEEAVFELYGNWEQMPNDAKAMIEEILQNDNLERLYKKYRETEINTKESLIAFEKDYPKVLTQDNLDDIIVALKRKKELKMQEDTEK